MFKDSETLLGTKDLILYMTPIILGTVVLTFWICFQVMCTENIVLSIHWRIVWTSSNQQIEWKMKYLLWCINVWMSANLPYLWVWSPCIWYNDSPGAGGPAPHQSQNPSRHFEYLGMCNPVQECSGFEARWLHDDWP